MKETAKETARQRKIYMILIIILIIVLTVLGGGYYFMMQTKAASQKTSGKNSDDQSQTSQTSGSDTLEYKGGIYKYNDHLSNYLFLGIDTRNSVDTYQTQEDAGQADAIFVVSMDRATEEMISAWFMMEKEFKAERVLKIYAQTWSYSVGLTFLSCLCGGGKSLKAQL